MDLHHHKNTNRFTFDCPSELHSIVKMKALSAKQSIKDYLINLIIKDISTNPPKYMSKSAFENQLKAALEKDQDLMRKLADK